MRSELSSSIKIRDEGTQSSSSSTSSSSNSSKVFESTSNDILSKSSMNKKHVRARSESGEKKPSGGEEKLGSSTTSRLPKKAKASNSPARPALSKMRLLPTQSKKSKTSNTTTSKLNLLATLALTTSEKPDALDTSSALSKSPAKKYAGPPRKLRLCLKDGCGKVLTGKQRKRCDDHHMLCIREGCPKFVQDHDAGLCINHGAVKCPVAVPKKVRSCLKEDCGKPLTGQQRTRCKDHHWQCIKKGCIKNEQSNYGGYCKFHAPFRPVRLRKCMKEGCLAELRNPNHKRCSLHKNMCLHGNCTKHQQSNCNGYCREHASDEDRNRALKVDREKKRILVSLKPKPET